MTPTKTIRILVDLHQGEQIQWPLIRLEILRVISAVLFFGQDAGSKDIVLRNGETKTVSWHAAKGLTQWVANNFEVLDLGSKPPTEVRKVDAGNRPKWAPLCLRLFGAFVQRVFQLDLCASEKHGVQTEGSMGTLSPAR